MTKFDCTVELLYGFEIERTFRRLRKEARIKKQALKILHSTIFGQGTYSKNCCNNFDLNLVVPTAKEMAINGQQPTLKELS